MDSLIINCFWNCYEEQHQQPLNLLILSHFHQINKIPQRIPIRMNPILLSLSIPRDIIIHHFRSNLPHLFMTFSLFLFPNIYLLIIVKVQLQFFVITNYGDYTFNGSWDNFCLNLKERKLGKDWPFVLIVLVADWLEELVGEGADFDSFYNELL